MMSAQSRRVFVTSVFGNANVFMDVDNLMAGQRFDKELEKALAETHIFIAVIGSHWMQLVADRLGASGAGKSSFLRAGLCSRLARDDLVWKT